MVTKTGSSSDFVLTGLLREGRGKEEGWEGGKEERKLLLADFHVL